LEAKDGSVIQTGYDVWGYNYQAHIFNGGHCDAYRDAAWCELYEEDELTLKWNDAWLSNEDCDGDEIGTVIWGSFAIVQEVDNDPCEGRASRFPDVRRWRTWHPMPPPGLTATSVHAQHRHVHHLPDLLSKSRDTWMMLLSRISAPQEPGTLPWNCAFEGTKLLGKRADSVKTCV